MSAGAATVAAAASACCAGPAISPLIVGLLGAGGAAWAAGMKPFAPLLLGVSGALLGYAFWTLRPAKAACDVEGAPPSKHGMGLRRVARGVTWVAAAMWLAGAALIWSAR